MSLSITKKELDAVVAELLLGGEGDTPEEAARDCGLRLLHAFLDIRDRRDTWCLVVKTADQLGAVGPYPTIAAVRKAGEAGKVHAAEKAWLARLRTSTAAVEHMEELR